MLKCFFFIFNLSKANNIINYLREYSACFILIIVLAGCGGSGGGTASKNNLTSPLEIALSNGDSKNVSIKEISSAIELQANTKKQTYQILKNTVFALNSDGTTNANSLTSISYDGGKNSTFFTNLGSQDKLETLFISNASRNTDISKVKLAIAGEIAPDKSRLVFFHSNVFANIAGVDGTANAQMSTATKNLIDWLTRTTTHTSMKVVVAHADRYTQINNWLTTNFPGVNVNTNNACNNTALGSCINNSVNLLIISQGSATTNAIPDVISAISSAEALNIPILYIHNSAWSTNDLGKAILGRYGISTNDAGNWFEDDYINNANMPNLLPLSFAEQLQQLVERLINNSFTTNFSNCGTTCATDPTLNSEFLSTVNLIRSNLRTLDAAGYNLFGSADNIMTKLIVLLGDKYRSTTAYPIDKVTSPAAWYQAFFADNSVYNIRTSNVTPVNLGKFATLKTNQNTVSKNLTITATSYATNHATGLYVWAGQSFTISRTDSSAAKMTFNINILRDVARIYDTNGYNRPKYVRSTAINLAPGQTMTITNPYGGPLYINTAAITTDTNITLSVSGAGTHPLLVDIGNSTAKSQFIADTGTTTADWLVIDLEYFMIHNRMDKWQATVKAYNGNIDLILSEIYKYMFKDTFELLGYQKGTDLVQSPYVLNLCNTLGMTCTGTLHQKSDSIQHVVVDNTAMCGDGCSGNPYDQDWALKPLGWGESHEIGHNYQYAPMKIYDGLSTETSNNIFPMHKQLHYNIDKKQYIEIRGIPMMDDPSDTNTPKRKIPVTFQRIKESYTQADPIAYRKTNLWESGAGNSLDFYRQLPEMMRYYRTGVTDYGWEIYNLLNMASRVFSDARGNDLRWENSRTSLGFSSSDYASRTSAITSNDFMLVVSSKIIGKDMRDYFAMWGISTNTTAQNQVASMGLAMADKLYFPLLSSTAFFTGTPITMSATAVYPSNIQHNIPTN